MCTALLTPRRVGSSRTRREPVHPALAGRSLTPGPPGQSKVMGFLPVQREIPKCNPGGVPPGLTNQVLEKSPGPNAGTRGSSWHIRSSVS